MMLSTCPPGCWSAPRRWPRSPCAIDLTSADSDSRPPGVERADRGAARAVVGGEHGALRRQRPDQQRQVVVRIGVAPQDLAAARRVLAARDAVPAGDTDS